MKKMTFSAAACLFAACAFGEIMVKDGDTFAFLGDSITQQGQDKRYPHGYVNLVIRALAAEGVNVKPIRAGISGHKSNDMLARLDRDVLSKKPKFMTLSCGVNDVWHQDFGKGVSLDAYKTNVTAILDKCAAAGCKVILMTATIFERMKPEEGKNAKLAPYNDFLRAIAKERGLPLADLNRMMWDAKAAGQKGLTADGVHMKPAGNRIMAKGILDAIGVNAADYPKIERDAWKPVWVLCRFDLKPDADRAAYVEDTKKILATVRREEGCLEYRLLGDCGTDWDKPQRFGERTLWMVEQWDSVNSLKAHLETPHMKAFGPKVSGMMSGSTFHVLEDVAQ